MCDENMNLEEQVTEPVEPKVETEPLFEEMVDFDTFSKSDFRVVKVKECSAVKKSKKLLHFVLDDGTGTDRIILSGIHAYYEPEELVGKTLLAITNLPRSIVTRVSRFVNEFHILKATFKFCTRLSTFVMTFPFFSLLL